MKFTIRYFLLFFFVLFGLLRCIPEQSQFNIIEVLQPSIEGKVEYGETLKAKVQETPSGWLLEVKWYREDEEITSAKGKLEYKLGDEDVSQPIRVSVRFVNQAEGLKTDEAFSKGTDPVKWTVQTSIEISGASVPKIGSRLEITPPNVLSGWKPKLRWYLVGQENLVIREDSTWYTIRNRDIGKKIKVGLSFVKGDRSTVEVFSKETNEVVFLPNKPIIEGLPLLGRTLYVRKDNLEGWYRKLLWYRGKDLIKDASGDSYVLRTEDKGYQIRVASHFTAQTLNVSTDTVYSDYTSKVNILEIKKTPQLTGSSRYKQTLAITNYEDAPSGWKRKFEWYRSPDQFILHQDQDSYELSSEDIGKTVKAAVVYYNTDGIEAPYFTNPSDEVTWSPSTPSLQGNAFFDSTMTAVLGEIPAGWKSTITWYRTPQTSGATEQKVSDTSMSTYTLKAEDIGTKMKVKVLFSKNGTTLPLLISNESEVISLGQEKPVVPNDGKLDVVNDKDFKFGEILQIPSSITPPSGWNIDVKWYLKDGVTKTLIERDEQSREYIIRHGDVGKVILAELRFTRGGALTDKSEVSSEVIKAGFTGTPTKPTIQKPDPNRNARQGEELNVIKEGDRTYGGEYWVTKQQWYRNNIPITDETKDKYLLGYDDANKEIKVGVYFEKANGARTDINFSDPETIDLGVDPPKKPTIAGIANYNQDLTASLAVGDNVPNNEWEVKAKWYRVDPSSKNEMVIPTEGGLTYTLKSEDVGSQVKVSLRFARKDGKASTAEISSDLTSIVAIAAPPKPVISGDPLVGGTLVTTSVSDPTGYQRKIKWYRDNAEITGENKDAYNVTFLDFGKKISVGAKFVNKSDATETNETVSDQTTTVGLPNPKKPELKGKAYTGNILTANLEELSVLQEPLLKYKLQWYRDDLPITGATADTIKLTATDLNKAISVGAKLVLKDKDDEESAEVKSSATTAILDGTPSIQPASLLPKSGSSVSSRPTFSWTSNEPDGGTLRYQILIGKSELSPPTSVVGEGFIAEYEYINFEHIPTLALDPGTKYYWKVVITDAEGLTAESSVLSFTTTRLLQSISYDNMGPITAVALVSDKYILTASDDFGPSPLRLIEISTGNVVHKFSGHTSKVIKLVVSKDGTRCVSIGKDQTMRTWNLTEGSRKQLRSTSIPRNPVAIDISDDGSFFYVAFSSSEYGRVRGYGTDDHSLKGEITATYSYTLSTYHAGPFAMDISPDGKKIAIASCTYLSVDVSIWSISSGGVPGSKLVSALATGYYPASMFLQFSSDNTKLLYNMRDKYWGATIVDIDSKSVIRKFPSARPRSKLDRQYSAARTAENGYDIDGHSHDMSAGAFVGNDMILTGSGHNFYYHNVDDGGGVKLWSITGTPKLKYTFLDAHTAPVTSIAVASDGTFAVTCSDDGKLKVWAIPKN